MQDGDYLFQMLLYSQLSRGRTRVCITYGESEATVIGTTTSCHEKGHKARLNAVSKASELTCSARKPEDRPNELLQLATVVDTTPQAPESIMLQPVIACTPQGRRESQLSWVQASWPL